MTINTTGDGTYGFNYGIITGITGAADGSSDGTVVISGGNYTGSNAFEELIAGATTDGFVNINSGAQVEVDAAINFNFPLLDDMGMPTGVYGYNYQNVVAGREAGSTGVILVDGAGTLLDVQGNSGGIRLGADGSGSMFVRNGAEVNTFFLDIARGGTSFGMLEIDGAGSTVNLSGANGSSFPNYAGEAAFVSVGRENGSTGYISISNGGTLNILNVDGVDDNPVLRIGRDDGSFGKVTVDGAGSSINISQNGPGLNYAFRNLAVGDDGRGILNISDGGLVAVTGDRADVAVSVARPGRDMQVDDASEINITSGGDLVIDAGSYVGGYLNIARNANSRADVTVDGAGSSITVNGNNSFVSVGRDDGVGTLTLTDGATFNQSGNSASFEVGTGNGAGAQNARSEVVINSGSVMNLTSDGNDFGAFISIGRFSDGNGLIIVSGAGSELNVSSNNNGNVADEAAFINVGRMGRGELTVADGGVVNITGMSINDQYPGMNIGRDAGGDGTVTVAGAGSRININGSSDAIGGGGGFVTVGRGGTGELYVSNGGQFNNSTTNSAMFIGRETTAEGLVEVTGVGSLVDGGELVIVGADFDFSANDASAIDFVNGGSGRITVTNGGVFRGDEIYLGNGGVITGDSTIDGNVTLNGDDSGMNTAELRPGTGAIPGATLNITGDLTMTYGSLNLEIFGTTPANNDLITIGGVANLDGGSVDVSFRNGFTASAGDSFTLVSADDLTFDAESVGGNTFDAANDQAFLLGDTGSDLVLTALNNDGTETGVLDFGADTRSGVIVSLNDDLNDSTYGYGSGSGGGFDSFAFINVSEIRGTNRNDLINAGNSITGVTLNGRAGDDMLVSGDGADTIDGGDDEDTVSYEESDAAVTVMLDGSDVSGGHAEGDTLSNIENVIGSVHDDLFGGTVGANTFDGGDGVDTVTYADSAEGITVFTSGRGGRAGAEGDRLNNIENITGSSQQDQIVLNSGSAVDNVVNAGDGDDRIRERDGGTNILNGEDGDDNLFGGSGNDTLNGGNDSDNLFGGQGNDTLNGGDDAARDALFGSSGDDILNGGGGNDALRGNTGMDTLNGGDGTDNLQGGNQNDILNGDAGVDTLDGGSGNDILNGGTGNDRLTGGGSNDIFIFEDGSGIDRITDFNFGSGDRIDLTDFNLADFDAVMALATEVNGDVRIQLDGDDRLILEDTTLASLDADDFIL